MRKGGADSQSFIGKTHAKNYKKMIDPFMDMEDAVEENGENVFGHVGVFRAQTILSRHYFSCETYHFPAPEALTSISLIARQEQRRGLQPF